MAYPYEDEDRKSALIQGLLGAGLAALGTRRGQEGNGLAQAGLLGLGGYNAALRTATDAREAKSMAEMRKLQFEQQQQEWQQKQQQYAQAQAQQAAQQRAAGGAFTGGMPEMGPPTAQGEMQPGQAPQFNPQAYIQSLQREGLPMQAIAAQEKYAKPTKKLKDTRTLMQNGQRVTVNMYDDGSHEVLPYAPDAEKLVFGSAGGMDSVGRDPFSGEAKFPGVPAQMGPGERARLGLEQQKFAYQKSQDAKAPAAGGDKWVNDLARGIQINMGTGETRPITDNGKPLGTQKDSKLVDGSQRALSVLDMADQIIADKKPTGSYLGTAIDAGQSLFGATNPGAEAVAQLQALEGALMMAQPRMEGPQSDRDVALYKQMAGKIGDSTVPNGIKKAAIATIRSLHKKYAETGGAPAQAGGLTPAEQAELEALKKRFGR